MKRTRKHRIVLLLSCLTLVALGATFVIISLGQSINLFVTPGQVATGDAPSGKTIRVGGLVVEGSIVRGIGTQVSFIVTDTTHEIQVNFDGILPDLFREGQAVVVAGKIVSSGEFIASEVLAKHDENYIPSEAAEAIMRAQAKRDNI